MNKKLEEFKELLKKSDGNKIKMNKAIERITSYLCGSILGRDFLETVESFYDKNPEIKEISDWSKTIVLSKEYKIIKI